MKKIFRLTALLLTLMLFAVMALGSGSSSSSGSSGTEVDSGSGTGEAYLSEQTGAEDSDGKENSHGEESEGADAQPQDSEDGQNVTEKAAWETGAGTANTYTDSIGSTRVRIAVPVTNTGSSNLYLSSGTMDLEDENGHLVDSKDLVSVYPQVIKPGETAWYFEDTIMEEAPSSPLTVVPHVKVKEATVACIRYDVADVTFTDETYGGIKVTGRVENTSDTEESWIDVAAMLYDENEQFLGIIYTYVTDTLQPGEKIGFSTSSLSNYDQLTVSDIAQYRIYAYPQQFQF